MAGDSYTFSTPTAADAQAIAASGGSSVAKDQAIVLAGAGNRNNLGGEYTVTGGSNLTINGAAGAEAIAAKFTEALAQINDSSSLDRASSNQLVTDALGKVSALSESKQTDGISSLGRLVLWGLAIGAAGLLIWTWRK